MLGIMYGRVMAIADTDNLSTPADMVAVVKRLVKIVRDVEALPEVAQARFWNDCEVALTNVDPEDFRLDGVPSDKSSTVLYNILRMILGSRLLEMVSGDVKKYYEEMLAVAQQQMQEILHCEWDGFLDRKLADVVDTGQPGAITASLSLHRINDLGVGTLQRIEGTRLVRFHAAGKERVFPLKSISMMEFDLTDVTERA